MNDEDRDERIALLQQNESLRAELDAFRQREYETLRSQLAEARAQAEHYRKEAQRNADIGKQIAADMERQIVELKTKNEIYERTELRSSRNLGATGRGR